MSELSPLDFDFELPDSHIAKYPKSKRDEAKLLVVNRATQELTHTTISQLPNYVEEGDCWVMNNTKVVPARFYSDNGKFELLRVNARTDTLWECMAKPAKKLQMGSTLEITGITGTVKAILDDGLRLIEWGSPLDLDAIGELPLPPYIKRDHQTTDYDQYQTVFAQEQGAIAAPTAGLHFTHELLQQIPHSFVTLHVGMGTFKPVKVDKVVDHPMHTESYQLPEDTAQALNQAKRVIAVGTTSTRTLESIATNLDITKSSDTVWQANGGDTSIFIYPPHQFRAIDGLLTNFHLPQSTLIMLISAFMGEGTDTLDEPLQGRDFAMRVYQEAIDHDYRFYSYGDAMLIL